MNTETIGRKLVSLKDVVEKLHISRTTLHRLRENDATFPKPIKDGKARSAPCYFVLHEIEEWIQRKMDERHVA